MIRVSLWRLRGVVVDAGNFTQPRALQNLFRFNGVTLPLSFLRQDMEPRHFIPYLLGQPDVQRQWVQAKGSHPKPSDGMSLQTAYDQTFLPESIRTHHQLIPGAAETLIKMRYERDIKLGLIHSNLDAATEIKLRQNGIYWHTIQPDVIAQYFSPTTFRVPSFYTVGISDNPKEIELMRGLGYWSIGITTTANGMMYDLREHLSAKEMIRRQNNLREKFLASRADAVVDDITNVPNCITQFNERLARNEWRL